MPIVATHLLKEHEFHPDNEQIYNALDCALTFEIFEELTKLTNTEPMAYGFERALQAPALEMMLRGFRIDEYERQRGIKELKLTLGKLDSILQQYAFTVWGKTLNPRSPKQVLDFFYGTMKLPEQWISVKGVRKLSTNRESLEKLSSYFHARPIISVILAIRDHAKQLEVLETEVDSDGRMRTSYNIAGTETLRWSSSASVEGTGTNLQNINPRLRNIFVADEGWKLCGIDLEQAESREVGWLCGILFNDWSYLNACYSGDLHTITCKLIWPNLGWTGDSKKDRKIAEQAFYRYLTYRDMSKRAGHGTNYFGTPFTMARHLKVPTKLVEDFQTAYFNAFPGIQKWHRYVAQELQTKQKLTTPFGITRHFFGRPNDDATLREAIAFCPQSSTGVRMNLGLWRIWKHLGQVQLLAQVHDAVYFQYKVEQEAAVIPKALELISSIDISHGDRRLIVPGEAKIGWNWASMHDPSKPISTNNRFNPNGLIKYKGPGLDTRTRLTGIDRPL